MGVARQLPKSTTSCSRSVEGECVGVVACVDEDAAEEGGADEAVGLGRDGVGEDSRQALAEERLDRVAQGVPLHEGAEGGEGVEERALHVGHAAVAVDAIVEGGALLWGAFSGSIGEMRVMGA